MTHHLKRSHDHLQKALAAMEKHHMREGREMKKHHPVKARMEHAIEGKAMHAAERTEHHKKEKHAEHKKHHSHHKGY